MCMTECGEVGDNAIKLYRRMVKFVGRPVRSQLRADQKKAKREPSTRLQIGWDDYNPGSMQPCRLAGPSESWDEKGKVSSRCFWNACKALSFGLLLMFIGTTMAILGYYADQLSVEQELRGNTTVRIKHEARGFHLNNLSYVGPIVMGVGGFIVVAACVMTFEARDSAAKVVPTPRQRAPSQRKPPACRGASRRSTSSQTKWPEGSSPDLMARRAITASFVQFSRELGSRPLGKSPSAPDLAAVIPEQARLSPRPPASAALLNPHVLLQRQALSVDNPGYSGVCFSPPVRPGSSQASMAMDLHLENPVTLRVRDRTRRSDTARRHVFVRQRPVEEDERSHSWSPRYYREEFKSTSTPHSRRESMARSPRISQEDRPVRSSSNDSRHRMKSTSRSASERSQLTPEEQPKKDPEIVVIEQTDNP